MRKVLVALLFLLPIAVWAQEKKEAPNTVATSKVFEVKPGNVERISGALRNLLGYDAVKPDRDLGAILVRTQPELMPAVEQLVRRMDAATPVPNNVEITVYLLEASRDPLPAAGAVPPDLQPTVTQLRNVFAYQSFQVLDTAILRSRSGRDATANGVLSLGKDRPVQYQLSLTPTAQGDERTRSVRIDNLRFSAPMPIISTPPPGAVLSVQSAQVRINADIDVKDGQKVVVGKTGLEGTQRALILVLSGKVVD